MGKNPNHIPPLPHHLLSPSRVFLGFSLVHMADAFGSRLNLGSPAAPRGRGHPHGSKNKSNTTPVAAGTSSDALAKRHPGRPPGSKNKPKVTGAAPGPIAPPPAALAAPTAPPRIFSFFCIAMAQCREIQRLPLNFTKFMDGRKLREAVLCEQSGNGIPYEVEVWYDGNGEQYLRGGWSQFAEDHDVHQGFFMAFDFHIGTSKFDVKIYDGTQCQKKYEAEV
jgi:hypothetical protein